MERAIFRSRLAMSAAGLLLLANIVIPLGLGDVYPFTSAPMFRDSPAQCCNYRLLDASGTELPAEAWLVHRVYDGNPIGYGVGLRPPAVIEQQFGVVHDKADVHRHLERRFADPGNRAPRAVEVVQEVVGPVDSQHVGVVRTERWKIARPLFNRSAPP
jgi:hypothetical protein